MRLFVSLMIGIVLGTLLGSLFFRMFLSFGKKDVMVPNVIGLQCQVAYESLKKRGFEVVIKGRGTVKGTSPRMGMIVRKGRTIELYCSEIENPDLSFFKGSRLGFVEEAASAMDLKVEISKIELSENTDEVLDYKLEDGVVHLLVNAGPPPKYVSLPDFRGMKVEDAIRLSSKIGIFFKVIGRGKTVKDQYPEPSSISTGVVLKTE